MYPYTSEYLLVLVVVISSAVCGPVLHISLQHELHNTDKVGRISPNDDIVFENMSLDAVWCAVVCSRFWFSLTFSKSIFFSKICDSRT